MTCERNDDHIRVEMTVREYEGLLLLLGVGLGSVRSPEKFWACLEFVNALNTGNSQFAPYAIPETYRGSSERLVEILAAE